MARLDLRRVVRAHQSALDQFDGLIAPFWVQDLKGRVVFGQAVAGGEPYAHEVVVEGETVGTVFGDESSQRVASLLVHLWGREHAKLALADETLGRYKELTLLYETSEALSKQLDVRETAKMVVRQAYRFLRAGRAALLLLDRRGDVLEPVASVGEASDRPDAGDAAQVAERVLRNGRAEFVDSERGSIMCAPLRTGETAFGILKVTHPDPGRWSAGDLKLVTSLAANAAAAISHGTLHRDQLQQQALRSQIERFVSAELAEVVLSHGCGSTVESATVLYCDIRTGTWAGATEVTAESVVRALEFATSLTLEALMRRGATVNRTQGEMLVAVFSEPEDRTASSPRRATDAGLDIVRRLDRRFGGSAERSPGVGIATVDLGQTHAQASLLAGIANAAVLQSAAEGRILIDRRVAESLRGEVDCVSAKAIALPQGTEEVYEVRP